MHYNEEIYQNFINDFSMILRNKTHNLAISKLIFLCIGTDRIIGDSFGPLIGYKLKRIFKEEENIEVIGDLKNTVSLSNAENIINKIYNTYEMPFIIAIDAAMSNRVNIGRIIVSNSKMNIASSFTKRKIYVGDISIKGIVSRNLNNPEQNFKLLQNVSLSCIMQMVDVVANGISNVINV